MIHAGRPAGQPTGSGLPASQVASPASTQKVESEARVVAASPRPRRRRSRSGKGKLEGAGATVGVQ